MRVTLPERVVGVKDAIFTLEVGFPAAASGEQTVVVETAGPIEPLDLAGSVVGGTYDVIEGISALHIPIRVVEELELGASATLVVHWNRPDGEAERVTRTLTILPASEESQRARRRGIGAQLGFVAGLLALLAVLGFWVLPSLFGGPEVPDTLGQAVVDAQAALERAGFVVRTEPRVVHRSAEHGIVLASRPPGGARLKAGGRVELQIGMYRILMRDAVGMSRVEALELLQADGLQVTVRFDGEAELVDVGRVTSQSPAEGENVRPGSMVQLRVGVGPVTTVEPPPVPAVLPDDPTHADPVLPPPLRKPDVAPKDPSPARPPIEALPGAEPPPVPSGPQDPPPQRSPEGRRVVPDVRGVERLRAVTVVKNAGLRARIELDTESEGLIGTVVSQDPAPGIQLARGARVILYVAR